MTCDIKICKKQSGFYIFKQQSQGVRQNGSRVKKTEKFLTKIWKIVQMLGVQTVL